MISTVSNIQVIYDLHHIHIHGSYDCRRCQVLHCWATSVTKQSKRPFFKLSCAPTPNGEGPAQGSLKKIESDDGRGYSKLEYAEKLSMATMDPVNNCSDCHFSTSQCRVQTVLTHHQMSGRIIHG